MLKTSYNQIITTTQSCIFAQRGSSSYPTQRKIKIETNSSENNSTFTDRIIIYFFIQVIFIIVNLKTTTYIRDIKLCLLLGND